LRGQLASRYPECSREAIDEAIQFACKSFLEEAEGITASGQIYVWIRTAALRSLNREADRQHREVAVDPGAGGLENALVEESDPAKELIAHEDDADLAMLVEKVSSSLPQRSRAVLALYGAGLKRRQIADRLGVPEYEVKHDLRLVMERARAVLARLSGGGCARGEPLIMRFICGISTPEESDQARDHLSHCGRCEAFSEKLIAWREKAGAMLPAPVAEGTSPGVVRHLADSASEKFSALKQHVFDSGAQLKHQVAAATSSSRAVDPTPIAGARPGNAVAVIASCLAIGSGAAGVCIDQGVNPLGAAKGLIASTPEESASVETTPSTEESTGPIYTPVEPTPAEEESEPTLESSPPPASEAHPEAKSEPKAEPQAGTSAAESTFEPASTSSQSTETEPEASYEATEVESEPAPQPAPPAPASSGAQQFQP
jgi:RNA polymerase sigma factor (sigma-70 family)